MSGAETWGAIERSVGGFWTVTRSQVFQDLKKLVGDGLAREASPGRYGVTAAAADAARSWFEAFALAEPRDDQLRSPLTLTAFFGHYLATELLARVVREHRLRLERRLDTLHRIEASLHEDRSLPGATLQRALGNVAGAIEWTDEVFDRITETPDPASGLPPSLRTRS